MSQAAEAVTRVHHSMHALDVLQLKQRCCVLLHYSVNAGEAPMTYRWVHGRHLGLSGDSGYGSSSTASTGLGYSDSSTGATSTHSTSHLVEHYQKSSMHPLAEGKLRYARTGLPKTVDFVVCMFRTLPELKGC